MPALRGGADVRGMAPQGFAALHPGLSSVPPSGRNALRKACTFKRSPPGGMPAVASLGPLPEGGGENSQGWSPPRRTQPLVAVLPTQLRPGGPVEPVRGNCCRMRSDMGHTYCSSLFHCVFSTKGRRRLIVPEVQPRLWAYMGGIAREHETKALGVGGMEDHAHILLSFPTSLSIAVVMREIKSGSSRWMHETCNLPGFEWQDGYGAFSIGRSQVENDSFLYREPERASPPAGLSGGVSCHSGETSHRIRSALHMGMNFDRPYGTRR